MHAFCWRGVFTQAHILPQVSLELTSTFVTPAACPMTQEAAPAACVRLLLRAVLCGLPADVSGAQHLGADPFHHSALHGVLSGVGVLHAAHPAASAQPAAGPHDGPRDGRLRGAPPKPRGLYAVIEAAMSGELIDLDLRV
jgi:hypothetical protein